MAIVESAIIATPGADTVFGPPLRLAADGATPTADVRWTVDRLHLGAKGTAYRDSVVNENMVGALLDSGVAQLAPSTEHHSNLTAQIAAYRLRSEHRRTDLMCHELTWPNGEAATIEVHAAHFVATWTCAIAVDRIGSLFEIDLTDLPDTDAEAGFAIGEEAYEIAPASLSEVLAEGVDEIDWFRVNLRNESFLWMRSDPRTQFGLFGLVSDRYDSRLILALLSKTATTLVRSSTRSMLRVLGDIYRAPGIEIRRPSMMDHFARTAEADSPWS